MTGYHDGNIPVAINGLIAGDTVTKEEKRGEIRQIYRVQANLPSLATTARWRAGGYRLRVIEIGNLYYSPTLIDFSFLSFRPRDEKINDVQEE